MTSSGVGEFQERQAVQSDGGLGNPQYRRTGVEETRPRPKEYAMNQNVELARIADALERIAEYLCSSQRMDGPLKRSELSTEQKAMAAMPINELSMSRRLYNALNREELKSVGEIVVKSGNELFRIKNLGRKSIRELRGVIDALGMPRHPSWDDRGWS